MGKLQNRHDAIQELYMIKNNLKWVMQQKFDDDAKLESHLNDAIEAISKALLHLNTK